MVSLCTGLPGEESHVSTSVDTQAAAFDLQFNYCILVVNDKLYCQHVVRY